MGFVSYEEKLKGKTHSTEWSEGVADLIASEDKLKGISHAM